MAIRRLSSRERDRRDRAGSGSIVGANPPLSAATDSRPLRPVLTSGRASTVPTLDKINRQRSDSTSNPRLGARFAINKLFMISFVVAAGTRTQLPRQAQFHVPSTNRGESLYAMAVVAVVAVDLSHERCYK